MKNKSTYNRYDIYLFLIIISAIYGRYGLIHPSSFLSLFFFPELLGNNNLLFSKKTKSVSVFLILWVLYAAISLLWVPNMHDAIFEISLLLFNSLLFMEIMVFSMKANRPLRTLALAWTCAFLITSVVAVWEINTDHHLLSAKEQKDFRRNELGDYMEKNSAIFTFYNPNTYIYFISLAFPFALYLYFQAKRKSEKLYYLIPIVLTVYVASQNSSRGGILTIAVMLSSFIYLKMKGSSLGVKVYIIIVTGMLSLILILYGEVLFQGLFFRLSGSELFEDNARMILWYASWQEFLNSYGLGMGTGSMVSVLETSNANMLRDHLAYSHCMIFEILLEYGAFFCLGIILFLFKLLRTGISVNEYQMKAVILCAVFSFPFYSVINSENVKVSFVWMFFASIFVFSIFSDKKGISSKKKRVEAKRMIISV